MKNRCFLFCLTLTLIGPSIATAVEPGFQAIFDGKTLVGWDGNPKFWSVQDGAITGKTTKDNPTKGNTFIVWRQGNLADFELRLKFRIVGGNSGIQYRSRQIDRWVIGGYQADFDGKGNWTGTLYEERGRGVLARRGQIVMVDAAGKKNVTGKTTPEEEILASVKKEQWNEYTIIAQGNHLIQKVNGKVTVDVVDNQKRAQKLSGLLALQLHAGPPMTVQFKDIRIKRLKSKRKRIIFMAGTRSHGYGSHEHYAGCMILAKSLQLYVPNVEVIVYRNGWPRDQDAFAGADAIVMYCDGGGRHPVNRHLRQVDQLAKKGVGIACIHYGVEVPKGEPGNAFLDWIGGYFETHWSVNPHWTADFKKLPQHPITRGVKPFKINDEWYYHMRFRPQMKNVTPILTAIPPLSTLRRKDGPHSGNPHVRKKAGQPQHMAWAATRPDGGRGFGFTGGHNHWNWGDPNFRKLVLNAILWISKIEVPSDGVQDRRLNMADLEENQDFRQPGRFDREKVKRELNIPDGPKAARRVLKRVKPKFVSKIVTKRTKGHSVNIDVDIKGAKSVFLVVEDGGNGYGCDWADWMEPRFIGPGNQEIKLTELKWVSATAGFGRVHVNRNCGGRPLRVNGEKVPFGIGTHANSIIEYKVPQGVTRFHARGGLDNGGTDQGNCGNISSVRFLVYTERPNPVGAATAAPTGSRAPGDAVAGLTVAKGLKATLFAAEPMIVSLTNMDIDYKGRVWVCEVVNYRGNRGKRPQGDRILILEDTNGDGKADKSKVYYQGRDVDSAMGICVLGNKVIVSCSPNVLVFTDHDGDDKPDKKELLFTKTGQPQHDHSAHSFLFGPDGKLYWNFGNTGRGVSDKYGRRVVDLAGNPVVDNGKPYFGGMPFRCNLDGSQFEVLGHNFRNNYELTVDSFGTIWQSDNDDDGNRGVRINYVMEFGNFGYKDEMTGAGWRASRVNMEKTVPLRHWHLNDPGVVPNLLQTGAGSPTGITVYEGRLLPKVFWDQVIHCDAGPNVVRAYPVRNHGAGYTASIQNVLHGTRDKWFRPADVCVAPDGSLFVTDWYDPGVGGHRQGDMGRGRLFRIAPPGHKYQVPKFNFVSTDGAIDALKNPSYSVRYLAWKSLLAQGNAAVPLLKELATGGKNPRHRARAIWLIGKIQGEKTDIIDVAIRDKNPNIRMVGLRLSRQLRPTSIDIVQQLVMDRSAQVRRECAIALRHSNDPKAPALWAQLARQHDGKDRWYLEALGIGADKQWDKYLSTYLGQIGSKWNTPAGRDIIWRSRAKQTPSLLAKMLRSSTAQDVGRILRSFDFVHGTEREAALTSLAVSSDSLPKSTQVRITTEVLNRLGADSVRKNPQIKASLERLLTKMGRGADFVTLVGRYNVQSRYPEVLKIARTNSQTALGVRAARLLMSKGAIELFKDGLRHIDPRVGASVAEVLGNSADGRVVALLVPVIRDRKLDFSVRRQAAVAVAKTKNGAYVLVRLAKQKQLDPALKDAVASQLTTAPWRDVKSQAQKLFPALIGKNKRPLPPIDALVRQRGSAKRGSVLFFAKKGLCANCHQVGKKGKEVGPNLSEIGGKLSRQAMFQSILFPSAGISHNYESYVLVLESGNILTGIVSNRTNKQLTITPADGIKRTFKMSEVDTISKSPTSLMPADLQQKMTARDLVDVVEFLTTLKKKKK